MLLELLSLIAGILLLVKGADFLVDAAKGLASAIGVPVAIIGLTIVSIGTSLPELVVSISASIGGVGQIAVGDVAGANIADACLLLGVAALIKPLKITDPVARVDLPVAVLATLVALAVSMDGRIDRLDGLVLIVASALYFLNIYRMSKGGSKPVPGEKPRWKKRLALLVLGLAAIVAGGKITLTSAVSLANIFHVSPYLIGLTVIALGTALPEVVTSAIASRRNAGGLAVGNSLGSICFNALFVLGAAALIRPLEVPAVLDMAAMAAACAILLPMVAWKPAIGRKEGALLVTIYLAYITYKVL